MQDGFGGGFLEAVFFDGASRCVGGKALRNAGKRGDGGRDDFSLRDDSQMAQELLNLIYTA
jgi:hypothetical protein